MKEWHCIVKNEMKINWNLIKNPKQLAKKSSKFLLSSDGTLKRKVIRGGFWVFALRIFRRGFEFIRTLVLARLLAPEDFGLMGIALLAMSALESFSQTGISHALIQKNEDIKEYLDTAWTIQVIRGLIIAGILFFGAALVGTFFGEPNAVPLTRALALSEIFKAFTHIGVVYFQKELEFHKQFVYQLSGTLADLLVSIPAAIILRNPWALVYGLLAGNFVRLIFSFIVSVQKLSVSINRKYCKQLINFGKYIFLQSIVLFLLTQGDDAFVGRYLGAAALGVYQLGYRIANITATELTHVISSITFPAYSKLQNNQKKLRKALKETLNLTSFFAFPIAGGIFILAPEFTRLFLGEQWLEVIPIIRILVLEGLMRSLAATFGPIYRATANLKIPLQINIIQLVVLTISILPFSARWGVEGTAIAVTIMLTTGFYLTSKKISRTLEVSILSLYKNIIPYLVLTFFMALFLYLLKNKLFALSSYFRFVLLVTFGIVVYLIFILLYYLATKKIFKFLEQ